jgi:PhzF family phenazine biosynthesis protein
MVKKKGRLSVGKLKIFQVDSFCDRPFGGNPASVCILEKALPDHLMQSIGGEMNLSETAFARPRTGINISEQSEFDLRWFTPAVEVDLCGHATLATARVLFDSYGVNAPAIRFYTKSGKLNVSRKGELLSMDLPGDLTEGIETPSGILNALGLEKAVKVSKSLRMKKLVVEVETHATVRGLKPNFSDLLRAESDLGSSGVIVTAPGGDSGYDFISRFFAPGLGINEDPVTGAAHTVLGPYWAEKLDKTNLKAYQASARGGEMELIVRDDRINLIGQAVIVLEGEISIP